MRARPPHAVPPLATLHLASLASALAACAGTDEPLGQATQMLRADEPERVPGGDFVPPGVGEPPDRDGPHVVARSNRQPARGFGFIAPIERDGEAEEDDDPLASPSLSSSGASGGPSSGPGQLGVSCLVANPIPAEPTSEAFIDAEFAALQHDQGPGQASKPMTDAIDQRVREIMCAQKAVGLGLGVVWKGKLAYVRGYGWARGWETATPADDVFVGGQRTRYRWASISKSLTGVASMAAAEEGLLDLDEEIAQAYQGCSSAGCTFNLPTDYWGPPVGQENTFVDPIWPYSVRSIPAGPAYALTPRMLLANRSGVQHYANGKPGTNSGLVPSEAQKAANPGFVWALELWTHRPLLFLPGTAYGYSSFGFNLMGAVLQNATATDYYAFVKSRIADKTITPMTTLHPDDIYDPAYQGAPYFTDLHRAYGYTLDDESGQVSRDASFGDVSYKAPGGGFISTTADLALFCEGLANDRFVADPGLVTEMWTEQGQFFGAPVTTKGYGLGFSLGWRKGKRLIAHNGSQEAAKSRLQLYPSTDPTVGKLCVVVMSSSRHLSPESVTNAVEDLIRKPVAGDGP
jgi:serine beta-lactamase-like protein LACTB, mitochondrial